MLYFYLIYKELNFDTMAPKLKFIKELMELMKLMVRFDEVKQKRSTQLSLFYD